MPSQLKQLKASLNSAGLARQQQQAGNKKNKRKFEGHDKQKRKEALESIQHKFNPFDSQVQRLKHDVGGRKVIGASGNPTKSRQAGIEQRKESLLPALENRNRVSKFKDRRFGEQDPSLDEEERMLERYTYEKQQSGKRSRKNANFNIEDNEELTHYGQKLSLDDDFAEAGLRDDDDDDENNGRLGAEMVDATHFGGFDEDNDHDNEEDGDAPPRKKTKQEVMEEVITKSKQHKMERQQQKEDDDTMRENIDAELDDIKGLLFQAPSLDIGDQGGNETYDQFVRQLAFDKRAKPTDRLKSDIELALEAKEELEKKEKSRQLRMRGEDDSQLHVPSGGYKARRQRMREEEKEELEEDDDEDEQLENAETFGVGKGLGEGEEDDNDEDNDEESDKEDEDDDDEDDDDDDDDDDEISDVDSAEEEFGDIGAKSISKEPTENLFNSKNQSKQKGKKSIDNKNDEPISQLPYTFPCPKSHQDLLDILESANVKESDVPTVIERIRVIYHPQLGEDNKAKLSIFQGVLLDHILYITSNPNPSFELMSILTTHLKELTTLTPIPSAQNFLNKLSIIQRNFTKGISNGSLNNDSKTWPSLPELTLLRIIGSIWSTSDYSHPVGAASELLMGQYLSQSRVRNLNDILSGLIVCGIFLQYEHYSKRYIPEIINFLSNVILILSPKVIKNIPVTFPTPDVNRLDVLRLSTLNDQPSPRISDKSNVYEMLNECKNKRVNEQVKVDLFDKCLKLIQNVSSMWSNLKGFTEAFRPIKISLEVINKDIINAKLKENTTKTLDQLNRQIKFAIQSKKPLELQHHKAIAIPSLIPKFEENYSADRNYDPDQDRVNTSKLRKQVKSERKGAIKELRKDAKFIAGVQQKKRIEDLEFYENKMRKKVDNIGEERAEEKSFQNAKAKAKRMAGK